MSELPNGIGKTRPAVSSSAVPAYKKPLIGRGGTEGAAGVFFRSFSSIRTRNFAAKDHWNRYRSDSVFIPARSATDSKVLRVKRCR